MCQALREHCLLLAKEIFLLQMLADVWNSEGHAASVLAVWLLGLQMEGDK